MARGYKFRQTAIEELGADVNTATAMTLEQARAKAQSLCGARGDALVREPLEYPNHPGEQAPTHLVGTRSQYLPGLVIQGGGWSFEEAFEDAGVVT